MASPKDKAKADSQTAIALITAYNLDRTNELWDQIYDAIEPKSVQYVMFAMAALVSATLSSYCKRMGISFDEMLEKVALAVEGSD